MRRTRRLVGLVAVLALLAAACGDDDDDDAGGTTPADDTAADETTTTGAATDTTAADDDATTTTAASTDDGDHCTEERVGGEATIGLYFPTLGLDPMKIPGGPANGGLEGQELLRHDHALRLRDGEYHPYLAESLEPTTT